MKIPVACAVLVLSGFVASGCAAMRGGSTRSAAEARDSEVWTAVIRATESRHLASDRCGQVRVFDRSLADPTWFEMVRRPSDVPASVWEALIQGNRKPRAMPRLVFESPNILFIEANPLHRSEAQPDSEPQTGDSEVGCGSVELSVPGYTSVADQAAVLGIITTPDHELEIWLFVLRLDGQSWVVDVARPLGMS